MKILQDILLKIAELRDEVNMPQRSTVPKADSSALAEYVRQLWTDAEKFEYAYYEETRHLRRKKPGMDRVGTGFSPEGWEKASEALAYGENWETVWGPRPEAWMKQLTEGGIPRKMRVRKSHITAKYHDFTISPNIENVNEIYNQERKRMGARDWIREFVSTAQTYGKAVNEIVVDYTLNSNGQIVNRVRKRIGRTPGSSSFLASDGCYYVIVPDVITGQQVTTDFPKLDIESLSTITETEERRTMRRESQPHRQEYDLTKFYQKYRVFVDDPSLERVPFTPEEESELIDEQIALTNGKSVQARKEQNHMEHIERKIEGLMNFLSIAPTAPDEELEAIPTVQAYLENLLEHLDFIEQEPTETRGRRKKYPNGRYLCWIGGKVVIDDPNPLNVPWRKLFREVHNEKVSGRIDGQGDPEIMYHEEYQNDILRSRIDELTLQGIPQKVRPLADKAQGLGGDSDNDPLRTLYTTGTITFTNTAPVAQIVGELTKQLMSSRANQEQAQGVNSIARGEQPASGTPASLVAIVQRQNRLTVTGELDANMVEALEDIIEGNLLVMREIYKQERQYVINGKQERINVSEVLTQAGEFEVTVKPGSNYPDQWETKLQLLISLKGQISDPGKATALEEAIFDHLAIEYPEFARGGEYRVLGEATTIGLQVMQARAEEEAVMQQQENRVKGIIQGEQNKALRTQITGGTNGKGKAAVAA